jgi:hypothetical protein
MARPDNLNGGRPTLYTPELAERILVKLAEGERLSRICEADDMPSRGLVHRWVVSKDDEHKGFREAYLAARAAGAFGYADEIIEISDDSDNDTKTVGSGENEREAQNTEWITRSKLRVDSRKFLMSKFLPEIFGDRVNVAGVAGAPIETKEINPQSRDTVRRIAFMLMGHKAKPDAEAT